MADPIQAESADGVIHEFPAGTDQSVIGKVMKTYALQNTKTAVPGYKFSDKAISSAINKPGTVVRYMSPDQYLALTPELESNPKTDKKGASLKASLDKGDDVDEVPSLDVTVGKDGTAKVVDQDGRHRAQFAKDAGVDLIPVAVSRSGEKGLIKQLSGMRDGDKPLPFDGFKQVLPPIKQTASQPAPAVQPAAKPQGLPLWDVPGDIGRAASGAASQFQTDAAGAGKHFAGPKEKEAALNQNIKDYGVVGGIAKDAFVDPVVSLGHALKLPMDAAAVALSPLTGTIHALAGSALSYAENSHQMAKEGMNPLSPEYRKMVPVDPKAQADADIDSLSMGLGAEGMEGGVAGIEAANNLRTASKAAKTGAALKDKALAKVTGRLKADGMTAQDVLDKQNEANAAGDKMTLMDIGGKNVKGLAGSIHRTPGQAGSDIDNFLEDRDKAVTDALTSDIHGGIAKGSTFDAMKGLFAARTAASKPAFDAAFAADSTAPFESQYRTAVSAATGAKGQIAKQMADIEKNNPGALAARGAAGADVRVKYMDLHQKLEQAENDRHAALTVFQKAKADGTANAPGAVWSPRLQEFMDNPEIRAGLGKALKLEKQDAVTEHRPFKDTDFGIVGTDPNGDPIIGAVPTMKSLAVAKEGLDARIADLKDPVTGRPTKAGLSLKRFRDEFVKELYKLNPRYKTAVDAWSGPSQSVDAIKEGKTHFSRPESNEEVKADFDSLTPSDKEFYRLGAAEAKIDQVERAPDASDKTKRVINSERDRKRFRMLFDSDADADKFITSVERKRAMFDAKTAIKGGSQTAGRLAEDHEDAISAGTNALATLGHAKSGNVLGAIGAAIRTKRDLGLIPNPALNSETAKILTDPNLMATLSAGPQGGLALIHNAPLPGVQNQLAKGIFRAAHVNGLRAMVAPRQPIPPQAQDQ